ncbi:hypothetical protein CHH83_01685 [Bacillus sp. 7586-K]|nr:hypothetical protein CHH83_01685 [Bacillus sp. 7586-K]
MTNKMNEIILVSPREKIFNNEQLYFQGLLTDKHRVNQIMKNLSSNYSEMRRGDAEENELFKQPIPYVLITQDKKVFAYKRLKAGGETRLHDQLSTGVGGHMNMTNHSTFEEILVDNLKREIEEELIINISNAELDFIGLVNDDENEVGKVHLGILATLKLPENETVEVREKDQLEGLWFTIEELKQPETFNKLETWSQYAIEVL